MPPRQIVNHRRFLSAAVAVALVVATVWAGSPATAVPSYTMEERATAIASPSMVYLESWASGFLRRKTSGEALRDTPFVLRYRCSGFVVSGQGHVVSSGHCIQPERNRFRDSAASLLAAERIKAGTLLADQKDAFMRDVIATTEFTGDNLVSAPTMKFYGQLFQGQGSLTKEPAWLAESIQTQPAGQGDVALIKFPVTGLPVVELSPEPLSVNAPIVPLGFSADAPSETATYTVRSASAKVIGQYGSKIPPLHQMDRDLGPVSRGGLVADSSGRVAGLINADLATKDRPNRIITNADNIRAAIGGASAVNSLSAADQDYRAGLDAYFGGRYAEAIQKFDSVLAAAPQYPLAASYRNQAADRQRIEGSGEGSGGWLIWLVAGLAVALLVCGIAILWLLVQQRRRQRNALELYAPVSAMPVSGYPISAIPVSGGAYDYYLQTPPHEQPQPEQQPLPPVYGLPGAADSHHETPAAGPHGDSPWAPPPPER